MAKESATYLYGKNSVLERLQFNPRSVKKVFVQKNFDDAQILSIINSKQIPFKTVGAGELERIKRADRLQGIIALVEKYEYTNFDALLHKAKSQGLSMIFLDNLNDPHNLGAILRSAACFGGFALVIPEHSSCEVNDTVIHVASGGENFVPVAIVTNMTSAIIAAKKEHYWVVGALCDGGENLNKASLPFPLCLVLGSEGKGIRYGLDKHLDMKVSIPMKGAGLSFNVAMAAAIFCYEVARQRK